MVSICIWFDDQAEQAAQFYVDVLGGSIDAIARYPELPEDNPTGKAPGEVMTVDFTAGGQKFQGLNGGPTFTPNEAISFVLERETQAEIDELWDALLAGGGEPGPCGWLKDRYGVSWQVVPTGMDRMLDGSNPEGATRAMTAMFDMGKLDIDALEAAYLGETVTS